MQSTLFDRLSFQHSDHRKQLLRRNPIILPHYSSPRKLYSRLPGKEEASTQHRRRRSRLHLRNARMLILELPKEVFMLRKFI